MSEMNEEVLDEAMESSTEKMFPRPKEDEKRDIHGRNSRNSRER